AQLADDLRPNQRRPLSDPRPRSARYHVYVVIPLSLPHFHLLPEREEKNRRRERKRGQDRWSVLGVAVLLCLFAVPARALDLKLWPLLDYHSDASGRRSVHLLGPLLSYETGDESTELTLR